MRGCEHFRHGSEEILADNFANRRKACFERCDKAHHDVVAIDGETLSRRIRIVRNHAARDGRIGVTQRMGESVLVENVLATVRHCGASLPHAAAGAARGDPARSRRRCAAIASARSTGHSGTSLSHSINVGSGPARAITLSYKVKTSAMMGDPCASMQSVAPWSSVVLK